jgi:hypothetical protein
MNGRKAIKGITARLKNRPKNNLSKEKLRKIIIKNRCNSSWGQGWYDGWHQGR